MEPIETVIFEECPRDSPVPQFGLLSYASKMDICKLCLSLSELKSLASIRYSNRYNNLKFLENELNFKLPDDVCGDCWQTLKDIVLFIKKCKDSYLIYTKMQQNCKVITEQNSKMEESQNIEFDEMIPNEEIIIHTESVIEEKVEVKEEIFDEKLTEPLKEIEIESTEEDVKKQTKGVKHDSQICSSCGVILTTTMSAHYDESPKCRPKNYKCSICKTYFRSRWRLQIHQQVQHSQSKLMCDICSKFLRSPVALKRHIKEHSMDDIYTCDVCKKGFKRKDNFMKHKSIHINTSQKTTNTRSTRRYNRIPKENDGKQYCCKHCSRNFNYYHTFFKHLQTHKGLDSNNKIDFKEGDLTCPVCKKEFKELRQLKLHSFSHKEKRVFLCIDCQDFFDSAFLYRKHLKTMHDKDKKFACPKCLKKYRSKQCLTEHLRVHEEPQKLCTFCGRTFHLEAHLKRHQAVVHNVNKGEPFRCKYCSKEFFSKGNLVIHERIHTGEKPFTCHVCKQNFIASNTRKLHVKRVHGEEEVARIKTAEL